MKKKVSVHEIITNQVIELLDKDIIPWKRPWNKSAGIPTNLISKKSYTGLNMILLSNRGMTSKYWLTGKQVNKLGGKIKKGEKGSLITFWKKDLKENEKGIEEEIFILRYYYVFNVTQCENLNNNLIKIEQEKAAKTETLDFNPIERADNIVNGYKDKPAILHRGEAAFYRSISDEIHMPSPKSFHSSEEYYSTLFHEMAHSTGHEKRLNRATLTKKAKFGSSIYSKEELVAELSAAFLCIEARIDNSTLENSKAYIQGWAKELKNNKSLIVEASRHASKASNYILGN